jgi:VanZ family protein
VIRWLIWVTYAVLWTYLLVFPVPPSIPHTLEEFSPGLKDHLAKVVHLAAYAGFAILTGWLRAPQRCRILLVALLMLHGVATELIQLRLSYRNGSLLDALFDHLGVILGIAVSWKWWTAPDPPP